MRVSRFTRGALCSQRQQTFLCNTSNWANCWKINTCSLWLLCVVYDITKMHQGTSYGVEASAPNSSLALKPVPYITWPPQGPQYEYFSSHNAVWTDAYFCSETLDEHFSSHEKKPKSLPDTFPYLKIYQNFFAAGEAHSAAWTPSWTWRQLLTEQGKGKRRGRKEKIWHGRRGKLSLKRQPGSKMQLPYRHHWLATCLNAPV